MIKYHVTKGARILFIGINPHNGSFSRGVPFSNNKMFWYLLSRSGIIKENVEYLRSDAKLKELYQNKFSKVYKLSLLNLIDRPSIKVTELKKGEENKGRLRILNAVKSKRPKIVCFVGKVSFQKFSGEKEVRFGWHPKLFQSKVFVMHFPIRGEAKIRIKELKSVASASQQI